MARPEATQHEDHPDRQRCDRRAVDEPGLTRLARDTVDGESLTLGDDGGRPILVFPAAPTHPVEGTASRAVSLNEAPARIAEAQGPGARLQPEPRFVTSPSVRIGVLCAPRRGGGPPPTVPEQEHQDGTTFLGGHIHDEPCRDCHQLNGPSGHRA